MEHYYDTETAFAELGRIEDVEELKRELLPRLQSQRALWAQHIRELVRASGLSRKEFASACGVSEASERAWRSEGALPRYRDTYIRIGFAAGCGLEEMNTLLMRYGRRPGLYARSLEDSALIYVLESGTLPHDYATYRELLDRMEREITSGGDCPACAAQSTGQMLELLRQADTEEALMAFVRENAPAFQRAYLGLYQYILHFLKANRLDDRLAGPEGRLRTIQSLAREQGWSSSLRHCIGQVRGRRWYPTRSKLISLGLHLNMDLEEIGQMLRLARMEPLYARDPAEAALIFALENAELEELICPDGETVLLDYVRDVLTRVELEEAEFLLERL